MFNIFLEILKISANLVSSICLIGFLFTIFISSPLRKKIPIILMIKTLLLTQNNYLLIGVCWYALVPALRHF